ncbi:MAG: hypothetical protein ACT4P0_05085 [Panacagrimonas sp.]
MAIQGETHGIDALSFDPRCAFHRAGLATVHHEAVDGVWIFQAIEHGLSILTPDPMIRLDSIQTLP